MTVKIVLLGVGGVGTALLRQILDNRENHESAFGLCLHVEALCDSKGWLRLSESAEGDEKLWQVLRHKKQGLSLKDFAGGSERPDLVEAVGDLSEGGSIWVDCTAADGNSEILLSVLQAGGKVALANKKALTESQSVFDSFSRYLGNRCRWEATVGAGLPIMVTLERFRSCGDSIRTIRGTLSGTLGYLMNGLQQGRPFSELVREAHSAGYTEPDPREDLGGVDVARKALILGRMLGWRMEAKDVELEGLLPQSMRSMSQQEFRAALPDLDGVFAERSRRAAQQNHVLRFSVDVSNHRCRVGPEEVNRDSPLGRLRGVDQLVEIHSRWYSPDPLVIQGRGAGVDATAAGVLSDIVSLARTGF